MYKVWEIRMDLRERERKETVIHLVSTQHTYGFHWGCCLPLFSSLLLGAIFRTVSCVPPSRLSGIMTEIKGHTATGCSAHLIDDVIGLRMTPVDAT